MFYFFNVFIFLFNWKILSKQRFILWVIELQVQLQQLVNMAYVNTVFHDFYCHNKGGSGSILIIFGNPYARCRGQWDILARL